MSNDRELNEELAEIAAANNLESVERHLFLCLGEKCCSAEQGSESWAFLKRRLKELGLANGSIYRTNVGCLRICEGGPVGLVYPEGTWYRSLTPENLEKVIQQHLINGKPVQELVFARHPLGGAAKSV